MDRLIVKNFGPLKDVDIELNKINLFIGENGSGKSVLGKLVTILFDFTNQNEEKILQKFNDYNINFLTKNTILKFYESKSLYIHIENKNIYIEDRYLIEIAEEKRYLDNPSQMVSNIKNLLKSNETEVSSSIHEMLKTLLITAEELNKLMNSRYIPAERNLISLFSKSLSSLLVADIPLPKFLLQFSSEFEKAGNELKELEFLNVKYVNGDGLDRHKVYFNDKDYLPLEHSSSGIQSALPLYLTVKYFAKKHSSIIIEEPEQNLFPKAQKETVEYIVGELGKENKLFMMTHSPYILTALNNLILANDVKEQKGIEALKGIMEEKYCVPFEEVSAYSLVDGKSVNIMDKEDRIIGVNVIDSISDEVSETFDKLLAKLD